MPYFLSLCLKLKPDPFVPFSRRNGARGGWRQACSRGQWGGNRRGLARPPQACWELARRVPPRRRGLFGGDFGRRPDAAFSENSALCSEALCVWRGRVSPAGSEAPRSPHLLPLLPRRRSRSFSRRRVSGAPGPARLAGVGGVGLGVRAAAAAALCPPGAWLLGGAADMVAAAAPSSARRCGLPRSPRAGAAVGSPWPWGSGPVGRADGKAARPPPAPLSRRPEHRAGPGRADDKLEGRTGPRRRSGSHGAGGARVSAGEPALGRVDGRALEGRSLPVSVVEVFAPRDFAAGTHESGGAGKKPRVLVWSSLVWAQIGVECAVVNLTPCVEAACLAPNMHLRNEGEGWHGPNCCVFP
ncbi:hypothetical protein LEMLEM_LOCUS790 [Lemmus lemmus]